MRHLHDRGMTLIEVVFAISILLIGVTFIVKSDSLMFQYRKQGEIKQQMVFYAAGQLERVLQNQEPIDGDVSGGDYPITNFKVDKIEPIDVTRNLESIGVRVSVLNSTNPPEPVTLHTYRVKQ